MGKKIYILNSSVLDFISPSEEIEDIYIQKGIKKAPDISKKLTEVVIKLRGNRDINMDRIGIIWASQYPNMGNIIKYSHILQKTGKISAQLFPYSTAGNALGCVAIACGIKGLTYTINSADNGVVEAYNLGKLYIESEILDGFFVIAGDEYIDSTISDIELNMGHYEKYSNQIGGFFVGIEAFISEQDKIVELSKYTEAVLFSETGEAVKGENDEKIYMGSMKHIFKVNMYLNKKGIIYGKEKI